MVILGIETSCDETAAALVRDGVEEISDVLATSREFHEKTGGIVPEIAARKQVEYILQVISQTLEKANMAKDDVDAIAVTVGPGLIGSLLIGVDAAKALAFAWHKPLYPVNHLVGHIYANFVGQEDQIEFPALVLVVSGGHTDLVLMHGHGNLEYLGGTLDDAAGEAFDKTARLLGISQYKLGGPKISEYAAKCTENTLLHRLPRPKINDDDFDFSFSGLKTAVRRLVETENPPVEVVACEFENAVVDVLIAKTIKAAQKFNVKSILLGGGVAANTQLRTRLQASADEIETKVYIPPLRLCGDNAIYIASAGFFNPLKRELVDIQADSSISIDTKL